MAVTKQVKFKTSSGTSTYDIGAKAENVKLADGTTVQSAINNRPEANIKKNLNSTAGDIIDTHLTVGTRKNGTTYGTRSATFGIDNEASGDYSQAEGYITAASGYASHAEGSNTKASGNFSHTEGYETEASEQCSHAEGRRAKASGNLSHAEGEYTNAASYLEHVQGKYNKLSTTSATAYTSTANAFIIGNGTSDTARSNAFRVTFNGNVYGLATFHSTGADYAEYFEWLDGNVDDEDRIGYFVTIENGRIRKASAQDNYLLGVVSANASIIGNAYEDSYHAMYESDAWGRIQYEWVDVPAEYTLVTDVDSEGRETMRQVEITPAHRDYVPKINPDYDPTQKYIPRSERAEWDTVGMFGQLLVYDDGTCTPGGFCTCVDGGIATASAAGYYVMARVTDSIIKILFK